jgi:hypothetical protein
MNWDWVVPAALFGGVVLLWVWVFPRLGLRS